MEISFKDKRAVVTGAGKGKVNQSHKLSLIHSSTILTIYTALYRLLWESHAVNNILSPLHIFKENLVHLYLNTI